MHAISGAFKVIVSSSLSSTYGTELGIQAYGIKLRSVVTRHDFKDERQVITVSQNPSSITSSSGKTLLTRFPTLKKDRVVVPGAVRLLYDVTLTRGTDLAARFVNNLGSGIIERLNVRMQVQEVQSLQSYGDYWDLRNLWLTEDQCCLS